ncbi:MAG: stage 0 sporulation family protein [Clostridia bacterium]|nr:stage 0 sporulation family protein [Clostridia bacterium]
MNNQENINELENETPSEVEIIGVKFKPSGKVYYFAANNFKASSDDSVIVETARGLEIGNVAVANKMISQSEIVAPLRPVVRVATPADIKHAEENKVKCAEAFEICKAKIADHKLEMNLVEAEYTFDNSKLLFYFTSDGRVDFRELVKDLASVFRTRIELRQIGIRDEAKLLGGLGVCGRPFCCASFLSDFVQVSIKMAKEQNFSLNSAKISGACGRLMCCLRYEHETYEEALKNTPPVGSTVKTPNGNGVVIETSPLASMIKVRLEDKPETPKSYSVSDVTLLYLKNRKPSDSDDAASEESNKK